jgi:hypothetical protein
VNSDGATDLGQTSSAIDKKSEEPKPPDLIESLAKHFPKETGELMSAIKEVMLNWTGSRPEQIKAEIMLESRVSIGFMILMGVVFAATGLLAWQKILSSDTVAFIFGTAFGSLVTFLYKFLMGGDKE